MNGRLLTEPPRVNAWVAFLSLLLGLMALFSSYVATGERMARLETEVIATRRESESTRSSIERRLDRLEQKLDAWNRVQQSR